jgi:MinD superfamily P-loop ATPase
VKQLVVLSGKGGTGKTTVAAALAHLASQETDIVLVDADVDAANLELVLSPELQEETAFFSSKVASIDPELCVGCGTCADVCRFDAVLVPESDDDSNQAYAVDDVACEGCAVCYYQCPSEAINMEEPQDGLWFRSDTAFGPLLHAHLFAGQENSGKLVAEVRDRARRLASAGGQPFVIIDGPPGIGCPVIAAATGVNLVLVVVEPTVSGIHDLERILGAPRWCAPTSVTSTPRNRRRSTSIARGETSRSWATFRLTRWLLRPWCRESRSQPIETDL